jgi:hypothetical protein
MSPAVTFSTFVRAANEWKLSVPERLKLLGGMSRSTYYEIRDKELPNLSRDTWERIELFDHLTRCAREVVANSLTTSPVSDYVRTRNPLFSSMSILVYLLSSGCRFMDLLDAKLKLDYTVKMVRKNQARSD